MKENYPLIMRWLAGYEGGYVNHPKDPGKGTNRGVTQKVFDGLLVSRGEALRDVRTLTDAEHDEIYADQYWRPVWGDALPHGLDASVFDMAVHSGVSRAVKTLQQILGFAGRAVDGVMGFVTMSAVKRAEQKGDIYRLVIEYNVTRMAFLRGLKTFATFGRGWTRRVMGERDGAQVQDFGVIDRAAMLARSQNKGTPDRKQTEVYRPSANPSPGRALDADRSPWADLLEALAAALGGLLGGKKSGAAA